MIAMMVDRKKRKDGRTKDALFSIPSLPGGLKSSGRIIHGSCLTGVIDLHGDNVVVTAPTALRHS